MLGKDDRKRRVERGCHGVEKNCQGGSIVVDNAGIPVSSQNLWIRGEGRTSETQGFGVAFPASECGDEGAGKFRKKVIELLSPEMQRSSL